MTPSNRDPGGLTTTWRTPRDGASLTLALPVFFSPSVVSIPAISARRYGAKLDIDAAGRVPQPTEVRR